MPRSSFIASRKIWSELERQYQRSFEITMGKMVLSELSRACQSPSLRTFWSRYRSPRNPRMTSRPRFESFEMLGGDKKFWVNPLQNLRRRRKVASSTQESHFELQIPLRSQQNRLTYQLSPKSLQVKTAGSNE